MRPPIERFQLAATAAQVAIIEPGPGVSCARLGDGWTAAWGAAVGGSARPDLAGGFRYRMPIVLAGEPVEAVAADHLVRIFHRGVLVAEHGRRLKPHVSRDPS